MTKNKGGESSQPLFSKLFYVGVDVTIYTFDDGSAMQECVFFRAQRASLGGEEEAGGIGRRQHHALVATRRVIGGVCVVYWS